MSEDRIIGGGGIFTTPSAPVLPDAPIFLTCKLCGATVQAYPNTGGTDLHERWHEGDKERQP